MDNDAKWIGYYQGTELEILSEGEGDVWVLCLRISHKMKVSIKVKKMKDNKLLKMKHLEIFVVGRHVQKEEPLFKTCQPFKLGQVRKQIPQKIVDSTLLI